MTADADTRMRILYWFYRMEQEYPGNDLFKELRFNNHPFEGLQIKEIIFSVTQLINKGYLRGNIYNQNEGFLGSISPIGIDVIEQFLDDRKTRIDTSNNIQISRLLLPHELIDAFLFKPLGWTPPSEYFDFIARSITHKTPSDFADDFYRGVVQKGQPKKDFMVIIQEILLRTKHYLEENKGYIYFWDNENPREEQYIQPLIGILIATQCAYENIDFNREVETGRGRVDFKFSRGYELKAHMEVKRADSNDLKNGLKSQLPIYLKADDVDMGFYFIVTYNKKDKQKVKELVEEKQKIEQERNISLNIIEIDVSRENKKSGSK
jgi:hypothetical protein